MAKGFKHGGGTSLNFSIRTYPSETELNADKPKENTIGLITTTTMTSWVFSAVEPTEPEVGMIWILVGASSAAEFNALNSNTLQVYPTGAKQYVNGAWDDVPAYTYQNVEWVKWITYLYSNGDECDYISGGWIECGKTTSGYPNKGAVYRENDGIKLSIGNQAFALMRPANMIDLTNVSSISLEVECLQNTKNNYHPQFYVSEATTHTPDNITSVPAYLVAAVTPGNTETFHLNVSNISGEYYVYIGFPNYENAVNIYKIREGGLRG